MSSTSPFWVCQFCANVTSAGIMRISGGHCGSVVTVVSRVHSYSSAPTTVVPGALGLSTSMPVFFSVVLQRSSGRKMSSTCISK